MYNRNNFRDVYADKPKGVTRKEYATEHPVEVNRAYYHYQSGKAKRFLRLFNDQNRGGQTEHLEAAHMNDKAIHMHHIFPRSNLSRNLLLPRKYYSTDPDATFELCSSEWTYARNRRAVSTFAPALQSGSNP